MKKKTCGELDIKKYYLDGRLFIKILVVYLAVVIFFYIAASHQILYTAHNQEALPDEETTEAVTDDRAVKQIFSYDGDYLRAICIKIGTYARKNTGYLKVSLKNIADDSILWHSSYDVARFDDNAWHQMNIGICLPQDSSRYCLDFSSEGCYEGNAITFYTCTAQDSQTGALAAGDKHLEQGRGLAMMVYGDKENIGGKFFWIYVILTAGGIALFYFCQRRKERSGKICILHVVCTTLDTYRFLIKQLVARDFKTKYKRSVLGVFWSLLNPLLTMMVQYVVFSTIFRSSIKNYPVYLLSASVLFNFFTESVSGGLLSIVGNASLITKVYVPKYIYPATKVFSTAINLLISMLPLFVVILITREEIGRAYFLIPFVVFCLLLFCMGMALAMSAFMVFFRDMQFLWGIISLLWMYATPMFYPEEIIPERFRIVLDLNPMYHYIRFFRTVLLGHESPQMAEYAVCLLFSVSFCAAGAALFHYFEKKFVLYL